MAKVDYPAILNEAWQKHLEPRSKDAPTVISIFAGCGGSSLGYSIAGFRELLAVEWDDNAVATFKLNFPGLSVYHGDIAKLSVEEVLRLTGLKPGELDVLDGSPPCQGFSTAGKRCLDDDRNQLFREYVRLLRGLQPKIFVMENVSGMVKGKMKLIFVEILRELKASGYDVSARLMNAMYFNVPQSRQRMIFIGVRNDLNIKPSHPVAKSKPITISQALCSEVDSVVLGSHGMYKGRIIDATKEPCPTICHNGLPNYKYGVINSKDDIKPACLKDSWQMTRVLHGLEPKRHFGLVETRIDKPAPTITKDAGNTTTGMIHPTECRRFTIPELKRLASYPDEVKFTGKYKEQWARIGNSVPPLFMAAIAEHIKDNILSKIGDEY